MGRGCILVTSALACSTIQLIVPIRVLDMNFVRRDTNNGAFSNITICQYLLRMFRSSPKEETCFRLVIVRQSSSCIIMATGACIHKTRDLTIALVHFVDFKPILTAWPFENVVVEFVPLRSTRQFGPWNPG